MVQKFDCASYNHLGSIATFMVVSKILLHNLYLFSFDFIVSVESFSNEMYEKNLTLRKCYDAVVTW